MRNIRRMMVLNFVIALSVYCHADELKTMEFRNQNITDVLLVLARESGNSIIPDEPVDGKCSFYFSDQTISQALDNFLRANDLYSEKDGKVIKVSRIKIERNTVNKLISVSANDVKPKSIIERLAKISSKTIIYESLPEEKISLETNTLTTEQTLAVMMKRFPAYDFEEDDLCILIKEKNKNPLESKFERNHVTTSGNLFSLDVGNSTFLQIAKELFEAAEKEYSFFYDSKCEMKDLHFENKTFDEMLTLIMEQGHADVIEKNGIYYVVELSQKNKAGKLKETKLYFPKILNAQEAVSYIPQDVTSASIRADKSSNCIYINGTNEEISQAISFLQKIDIRNTEMECRTVKLQYMQAKDVLGIIPQNFRKSTAQIGNTNALLVTDTKENISEIERFIEMIDIEKKLIPFSLKYINVDELLKNIPPAINKEDIMDSGYPNLIFFTGSDGSEKIFEKHLELTDRPKPQIKYQVLVIQYKKNNGTVFKPSISAHKTDEEGKSVAFNGDLSNIMSLSFDVISQFGYNFAASLNAQISENRAKVFTDTTLTAITGQEIKFQNTDTYRYIEYEYDKNSGNTTAGTTQQITSGLIVSLNGWISGDNMITMNINATISKQNGDTASSREGNLLTALPSTSERIVTTQVRTKSGKPVVISGLIKEEENNGNTRISLLSKIPLIGKLFTQDSSSREKSEIVVYIVPHLIRDPDDKFHENYEKVYALVMENK